MDLETEKYMYSLLKRELNEVTYISVGHRPSLLPYHNRKLIMRGPGHDIEMVNITIPENSLRGNC